jgi:hypothetical protein
MPRSMCMVRVPTFIAFLVMVDQMTTDITLTLAVCHMLIARASCFQSCGEDALWKFGTMS